MLFTWVPALFSITGRKGKVAALCFYFDFINIILFLSPSLLPAAWGGRTFQAGVGVDWFWCEQQRNQTPIIQQCGNQTATTEVNSSALLSQEEIMFLNHLVP